MKKNRISRLTKSCSIAFILFIQSFTLFAQFDFFEGYIIKNNNDTVFGLIRLGGGVQNANECVFKKDLDSETITYLPFEIAGYRFLNGKYYVSETISYPRDYEESIKYENYEIDKSKGTYSVTDNSSTETKPDSLYIAQGKLVKKNVFLEFLINGTVDVYSYYDNYKNPLYFFKKGEDSLIFLKNTKADFYSLGHREYNMEKKEYIGILNYMLQDCEGIQSKINNTDLENESLIKLSKYYHTQTCNTGEPCIVYEKENRKIYISLIPTINYSNLQVSATELNSAYEYEFTNQNHFSYGVKVKFSNFQYFNYHLTSQTGIIYQKQYFESEDKRTKIELKVLEFPLELNYSFLKNSKLNPFIGLSVNLNLRINKHVEQDYYAIDYSILDIETLILDYSCIAGIDYYFRENMFLTTAVQYKVGGPFYSYSSDNSTSKTLLFRVGFGYVLNKAKE